MINISVLNVGEVWLTSALFYLTLYYYTRGRIKKHILYLPGNVYVKRLRTWLIQMGVSTNIMVLDWQVIFSQLSWVQASKHAYTQSYIGTCFLVVYLFLESRRNHCTLTPNITITFTETTWSMAWPDYSIILKHFE